MKKFEPKSIKDILNVITKTKSLEKGLNNVKAIKFWKKSMGHNISQYTKKVILKENTLYIYINSATLKEELSYEKEKIIQNLNEAIGENIIQKIIFV